jgi:hypothetical protein
MRTIEELDQFFKSKNIEPDGITQLRKYSYSQSLIGFYTGTSEFCCGMPEFGDFYWQTNKYNTTELWQALLEYYVQREPRPFFLCSTLTTKRYEPLNIALAAVGFEQRSILTPNGNKRYRIIVWEYIRPAPEKKANKIE